MLMGLQSCTQCAPCSWDFCCAHTVFRAPGTFVENTVCSVLLGFMSWTWCAPCSWDFYSSHSVFRAPGTFAHGVPRAPGTFVLHTVWSVHVGFLLLTWCALCSCVLPISLERSERKAGGENSPSVPEAEYKTLTQVTYWALLNPSWYMSCLLTESQISYVCRRQVSRHLCQRNLYMYAHMHTCMYIHTL